jgi:hypothetical protein
MMKPTPEMEIIATSPCLSPKKWGETQQGVETDEDEPEIIYIPDFKALCVQGHPEWLSSEDPLVKITKHLLEERNHL